MVHVRSKCYLFQRNRMRHFWKCDGKTVNKTHVCFCFQMHFEEYSFGERNIRDYRKILKYFNIHYVMCIICDTNRLRLTKKSSISQAICVVTVKKLHKCIAHNTDAHICLMLLSSLNYSFSKGFKNHSSLPFFFRMFVYSNWLVFLFI